MPAAPPADAPTARATQAASRFRPDIEGLRAVAVLAVVAHHVGIVGFDAGFVGVDVFFVISGFLIAGKLLAEIDDTGRLDLPAFWAGRARRLLPIAATVITTTFVAAIVLSNPLDWADLVDQARAATFFVANHHFATIDTGYFATATRESPFLHLWSLAVEEQFYVVLPVVLAVTLRLRRDRSLELPALAVGALSIGSLVAAAVLTGASGQGYYSLASRGWELGAGVLLAIAWRRIDTRRTRIRTACTWAGLAILVAGLAVVDVDAFPAWGALFPVAATVLVLVGQPERGPAGRTLCSAPMRAIGRWSYGWYLWHWPALVLGTEIVGTSLVAKLALAGASLALAAATFRLIENPVRRSGLATRPSLVMGAGILAGLLLVAQVGQTWRTAFFRDDVHGRIAAARADHVDIEGACIGVDATMLRSACRTGPAGARPILLFGDSHMAHWRPAIEPAAAELGVPTTRSILGNCFGIGEGHAVTTRECRDRAEGLDGLLDDLDPAAFVLGTAAYGGLIVDGAEMPDRAAAWRRVIGDLAGDLRDRDIPLLVIFDTPRYRDDPLECMVEHDDWARCTLSTESVTEQNAEVLGAIRRGLADAGHGVVFDPVPVLCPGSTCLLDVNGHIVPQDTHHVTSEYAATQTPLFVDLLGSLLATTET